MAREQILPDMATLRRWVEEEGLTHNQVAERVLAQTGQVVTRSAVSVALHRAGVTQVRERYSDTIPWTLHGEDLKSYPARMLRLLARRRRDLPLSDEDTRRLDRWLERLEESSAVVAFSPTSNPSLIYVQRRATDSDEVPIRREPVYPTVTKIK